MTAEHAAAPRAKAAFATQAGALLRKNARYQQKNWCALQRFPESARPRARYASRLTAPLPPRKTNCCLVLTPLVFSVVLGSAHAGFAACGHAV